MIAAHSRDIQVSRTGVCLGTERIKAWSGKPQATDKFPDRDSPPRDFVTRSIFRCAFIGSTRTQRPRFLKSKILTTSDILSSFDRKRLSLDATGITHLVFTSTVPSLFLERACRHVSDSLRGRHQVQRRR